MSQRRNRGRCEKCKRRPGQYSNLAMAIFMTGYKYLTLPSGAPWRQPICVKMNACVDCRAGR